MKILAIAVTLFFSQASFSNDEELAKALDEQIATANKYLKELEHLTYSTPIECVVKTQNLVQDFLITEKNIKKTNTKLEGLCKNATKITPEVKKLLKNTLLEGKKYFAQQKDDLEIRATLKSIMAQSSKKQVGESHETDSMYFKDIRSKNELRDLERERPAVNVENSRK